MMVLDKGLSTISVQYINIVLIALFIAFIVWRYVKDYTSLKNVKKGLVPKQPYMQMVSDYYQQELQQCELQLQQMKLDLAEEQDNILAWVHEMKSPLTALKLMHEQVEPYQLREKLDGEWLRLHLLLDQRLHATRLLTMEKDNRLERVELSPLLMKEIKELRTWCLEKGIAIEVENIDHIVLTDAKWLAFIFRQIFTNAIKYSEEHSEIVISAQTEEGQVILAVKDKGKGIATMDLPRIFHKSYTGSTGRETTASTGMGLYLAKQAADKLLIHLTIESIVHQGTTVFIRFPKRGQYEKTYGI